MLDFVCWILLIINKFFKFFPFLNLSYFHSIVSFKALAKLQFLCVIEFGLIEWSSRDQPQIFPKCQVDILSSWSLLSTIWSLITYNTMPIERNTTLKMLNVIMVLIAVGTGLHAGRVCYLNLDYFNFSIFSRMRYFSSADTSISYFPMKLIF